MRPAKDAAMLLSRKFSGPEGVEIVASKILNGKRAIGESDCANSKKHSVNIGPASCRLATKARMYAVVLSIGAGSMFMISLDSVVDNLIPVARQYLINLYGSDTLADIAWSWVVSSRSYGLAFGCFCAFLCSNWPSRKWPLITSFLITFLGGILSTMICIPDYGISICCLGRFLSGIGSGLAQVIGSAMLAEIPPLRLRGTCLASLIVWACVGELTGLFLSLDTILGTSQTWHIALGCPVLIIPFALLCLFTSPDSPRILLLYGKENEAFASLQFYQKSKDWIPTLKEIRMECLQNQHGTNEAAHEEESVPLIAAISGRKRSRQLLKSRFANGKFVRPLFMGTFVLTLAHLDDWLWIQYSTQAFENEGASPSEAQRSSLWMAFPQALISIALMFCFDEFSRRKLLIFPTLGSVCCAMAAIYAVKSGSKNSFFGLPLIASLDLCMAAIASESAYSVVPELFQQNDRIMGTALIGGVQNIFGGFLTTIMLPLMNERGIECVLIPFILINLIYVLVINSELPETNGKSFYEISEQFSEQLPKFPLSLNCIRAFPRFILIATRKILKKLMR